MFSVLSRHLGWKGMKGVKMQILGLVDDQLNILSHSPHSFPKKQTSNRNRKIQYDLHLCEEFPTVVRNTAVLVHGCVKLSVILWHVQKLLFFRF